VTLCGGLSARTAMLADARMGHSKFGGPWQDRGRDKMGHDF